MFGGIIGIFLIGLMIYALLVMNQDGKIPSRQPDALSILKHRYARGEISDEEYQRKKEILEK
jgi:putative membrane protein